MRSERISRKYRAKKKKMSTPKINDTEKNLSTLKKYHDQDEDYYKSIETKSAFNANYIEYEAMGTKIKILQLKDILI